MAKTNGGDGGAKGALTRSRLTGAIRVRPLPNGNVPSVVSQRKNLRDGLPSVYQDNDFGLRFVGALEGVLDPIGALLESMPAHLDPDLTPSDILELLEAWLGVELDESWPEEQKRELVRNAGEIARRHGTKSGLEMTLRIVFPNHPLRVEDGGKVAWSTTGPSVEKPQTGFIVYCDKPLDERELAAVSRLVEQVKPVNVSHKLRVKAAAAKPKPSGGGSGRSGGSAR